MVGGFVTKIYLSVSFMAKKLNIIKYLIIGGMIKVEHKKKFSETTFTKL